MTEKTCTWCGAGVLPGVTRDAVTAGALTDSRDDVPTLCQSCNQQAKRKGGT